MVFHCCSAFLILIFSVGKVFFKILGALRQSFERMNIMFSPHNKKYPSRHKIMPGQVLLNNSCGATLLDANASA